MPKDHYDNSQNHDSHDNPQDEERLSDLTQTRLDGICRAREHLVNVPACSVLGPEQAKQAAGSRIGERSLASRDYRTADGAPIGHSTEAPDGFELQLLGAT